MCESSEFTDDISFEEEAKLAIGQIWFGVKKAEISGKLECDKTIAYVNIQTLEDHKFCVSVSQAGYKIVSFQFDCIDTGLTPTDGELLVFETIDALMNNMSKLYIARFHEELTKKLIGLQSGSDI
jgi:hypothetical protein